MEFKRHVLSLRRHFEQFNLDAAEICQWLMGLRPSSERDSDDTRDFWEFFLNPNGFLKDEDQDNSDRYRRMVFDATAGIENESSLAQTPIPQEIQYSIRDEAVLPRTTTAKKLFQRLAALVSAHRQVLLKAAAEWIVTHYQRGYENWERQHAEWKKEKEKWEADHPELTGVIRQNFNEIFKALGIKDKRPRVCLWERLKESRDNCEYAGERIKVGISWKSHAALCFKYKQFLNSHAQDKKYSNSFRRYFVENTEAYLKLRRIKPKGKTLEEFTRKNPRARWFPEAWEAYLEALGIKEKMILQGRSILPHCVKFRGDKDCEYNKHTENCEKYRSILDQKPDLQELDGLYREWRREYLSGPKKPSFRYPSKHSLPMAKIFGKDFGD